MRTYRMILTGVILTCVAMTQVHQRIEVVKAGYRLQKKRQYLSYLIDRNSMLMYNLSKLESPSYLLSALDDEKIEFANRKRKGLNGYQLTIAVVEEGTREENPIEKFLDLFTIIAEAKSRG